MRQHRGNEVFIAANLKLRVVKYEYICHFYFFNKATILQLNLTIQQRLGVGNSPPLRWTCFWNKIYISRLKIYLYKKLTQGGPPLLSQRGRPSISIFSLESLLFRKIMSSPLAVPKIVCSLFTSHNFDRYANSHFLYRPQGAVVFLAPSLKPER